MDLAVVTLLLGHLKLVDSLYLQAATVGVLARIVIASACEPIRPLVQKENHWGDSTGNVEFNVGDFQKIKRHRLCLKVSENLSTVLLTGI